MLAEKGGPDGSGGRRPRSLRDFGPRAKLAQVRAGTPRPGNPPAGRPHPGGGRGRAVLGRGVSVARVLGGRGSGGEPAGWGTRRRAAIIGGRPGERLTAGIG